MRPTAPARRRTDLRDADGMAVASFVLGLLGLLGLFLGAADLVVLAVLVGADSTVSWSF